MSPRNKIFVLLILSSIYLGGCALNEEVFKFDVEGKSWPAEPQTRRIIYVGEFSKAEDLSIKDGFWRSLVNFAAGSKLNALSRPVSVAATNDGQIIFVADPGAGCVHRFDLTENKYRCLTGANGYGQIAPIGLAVTEEGTLFVSDSAQGQLWRADPQDKELTPFLVSASLKQPTGIAWSSKSQRLYVADTKAQVLLEFDRLGNEKRTIGERGNRLGQFNYPIYVWVNSDNELLVTDSLNFRIQRFASDLTAIQEFGEDGDHPGDFSRPKGVATDSFGNVYVVDALMHMVQIFSSAGELLLVVGEQGQGEGQFWLPNGIFITSDNTIFVADSYNKRIQVFRYVGPES